MYKRQGIPTAGRCGTAGLFRHAGRRRNAIGADRRISGGICSDGACLREHSKTVWDEKKCDGGGLFTGSSGMLSLWNGVVSLGLRPYRSCLLYTSMPLSADKLQILDKDCIRAFPFPVNCGIVRAG